VVQQPSYIRGVVNAEFDEENWDEFGVNGMYFTLLLELGENFVVSVAADNEEDVDFHLLVCT